MDFWDFGIFEILGFWDFWDFWDFGILGLLGFWDFYIHVCLYTHHIHYI